jgi:hypothetical protein
MRAQHTDAFLDAARIADHLVREPAVTESWAAPSALEGMSVGALACHLGSQLLNTRRLLAAPQAEAELIPLLEHYRRAAWVRGGPDDEANVGIRSGAAEQADLGPDSLKAELEEALVELPALLTTKSPSDPVLIPWQGWALTRDALLTTRMMEIVVHSDDLACSVELSTPRFPDRVMSPVLDLLVRLSISKHGQASVVRALARKERAPRDITAF